MKRQWIHLPSYDWTVYVYYWAGREDAEEILGMLQEIGCSESALSAARQNLHGSMIDTGLTYTNDRCRSTVIVISRCSSTEEFWNTLDHEKGHATQHIGSAIGLDYAGEEQQYLAGELSREMYPAAKPFICGC